jgi:thiaminase/transcriptional activator TenA
MAAMSADETSITGSWTAGLWQEAQPVLDAVLTHPFLTGLADGSLPPDRFAYYLAQDAHYLRDYARTLAVVGAKAPTHADVAVLSRHAAATAEVEVMLHETLLPKLGIERADVPVSPTTTAYCSFLLAVAYGESFPVGLAAVLPCYWLYQRVGAALVERGSPDARYQMWIDTYAGDEFATAVDEVLELADRTAPTGVDAERARSRFATTARYEWMFWDAAWRCERWPIGSAP